MICSRCQANVDGSDYPHWQKVCWPCKATLDAREEVDRLEKENRELRTKQQLSVSSNWGIECSRSVAEIENEELRAQLAALTEQRDYWESAAVEMRGYKESATTRAEKAEAERDALAARVAELEGALKTVCPEEAMIQDEQGGCVWCGASPPKRPLGSPRMKDHVGFDYPDHPSPCAWLVARRALARTPAQSLAKVQAAALREAAKLLETKYQEGQAAWCLKVEADRLEAEAANATTNT